jgi:hypothetical protein
LHKQNRRVIAAATPSPAVQAAIERAINYPITAPDRVLLDYDECAALLNCSKRTWQRIMQLGDGPPYIEVTTMRRGIMRRDFDAWLETRRRPSGSIKKRPRGRPRKLHQIDAAAE